MNHLEVLLMLIYINPYYSYLEKLFLHIGDKSEDKSDRGGEDHVRPKLAIIKSL